MDVMCRCTAFLSHAFQNSSSPKTCVALSCAQSHPSHLFCRDVITHDNICCVRCTFHSKPAWPNTLAREGLKGGTPFAHTCVRSQHYGQARTLVQAQRTIAARSHKHTFTHTPQRFAHFVRAGAEGPSSRCWCLTCSTNADQSQPQQQDTPTSQFINCIP